MSSSQEILPPSSFEVGGMVVAAGMGRSAVEQTVEIQPVPRDADVKVDIEKRMSRANPGMMIISNTRLGF